MPSPFVGTDGEGGVMKSCSSKKKFVNGDFQRCEDGQIAKDRFDDPDSKVISSMEMRTRLGLCRDINRSMED